MEKNKFAGFKTAEAPKLGLALIFDLSGFSNFFNKPDLHFYITKYINHIIESVEICLYGGEHYWLPKIQSTTPLSIKPSMRKFLGDGILYVWENDANNTIGNDDFKQSLLNGLWNLQTNFSQVNKKLFEEIPTADLPKSIKFGIAQGTVYKLIEEDGSLDYIGPCINLAARLVKYCSEINFICSARVDLDKKLIGKHGYFKIIAKELKSFENEIVIIDQNDYKRISAADKKRLFEEFA